jgi:two-component system cell cycle response regulator DivK
MAELVLLVEDNEVNRYLARFLLEHGGFTVLTANNGLEAIEQARARKPDLILMDIQMPVMDGYEATRLLKADGALRSVPVVALTAYAMPHERERALASGCVGHIEKPIDTRTFIAQLRVFLGRAGPDPDSGA